MTRFFVALSLVLALTASAMPTKREGLNGELDLASTAAHILESTGSSLDKMNPGRFGLSPEAPSEGSSPEVPADEAFSPEVPADEGSSPEVPADVASLPHAFVNPPPEDPVDESPMPTPSTAAPSSSAVPESTPSESTPSESATATEHTPSESAPADRLMGVVKKFPVLGPLVGALGGAGGGAAGGLL